MVMRAAHAVVGGLRRTHASFESGVYNSPPDARSSLVPDKPWCRQLLGIGRAIKKFERSDDVEMQRECLGNE
ncbi:hypothetical protein Tco_0450932 [Tanacetum coccineum]